MKGVQVSVEGFEEAGNRWWIHWLYMDGEFLAGYHCSAEDDFVMLATASRPTMKICELPVRILVMVDEWVKELFGSLGHQAMPTL